MSNLRVAVVGAGVVGLSTAAVVKREWPNVELTVLADGFVGDTTSSVAAGYFIPNVAENAKDAESLRRWTVGSGEHYRRLATGADAGVSGVAMATVLELSSEQNSPPPLYCHSAFSCTRVEPDELLRLLDSDGGGGDSLEGVGTGHVCLTAFAECRKYLPYLTQKWLPSVELSRRRLDKLTELSTEFDLVFNCSGLGAARLCGDRQVLPIRGQVVRVRAPHVKIAVHGPGVNYVLPNLDTVVLGGTAERNSWDASVRQADTADILRRCRRRMPSLHSAEIVGSFCGLRPHRVGGARVEAESQSSESSAIFVHNYGHGANGVGLSWGSGEEAVAMAREAVRRGRARL